MCQPVHSHRVVTKEGYASSPKEKSPESGLLGNVLAFLVDVIIKFIDAVNINISWNNKANTCAFEVIT